MRLLRIGFHIIICLLISFGESLVMKDTSAVTTSTTATKTVLVIGSCGLDRLLSVSSYPEADAKVRTTSYNEIGGGNAANTATAMARLRNASFLQKSSAFNIQLCSKVGADAVGRQVMEELKSDGVDLSSPLFQVGPPGSTTGFTTIIVSEQEKTRTCIHTPGTCGELTAADVEALGPNWDEIVFKDVVHLHSDARHTDVALLLAQHAKRGGRQVSVSLDVEKDRNSPALDELLEHVDTVFTNAQQIDTYLNKLTKQLEVQHERKHLGDPKVLMSDGVERAAQAYLAHALRPSMYFTRWYKQVGKQVVITKGERGALSVRTEKIDEDQNNVLTELNEVVVSMGHSESAVVQHEFIEHQLRPRANCQKVTSRYMVQCAGVLKNATVVDTTGAGDAFIGGYIMSMLGYSLLLQLQASSNEFNEQAATKFFLQFGCWVGGCKLAGPGARSALPRSSDVDEQLGTDSKQVEASLATLLHKFQFPDDD